MSGSDLPPPGDPPTTVGRHPDDQSRTVAFPEGALNGGCYLEGSGSPQQTALLHSWCVEWAEAGYSFCYIHPGGPEPRDLIARLPEDRLDDVVWIDLIRDLPDEFDVPTEKRVTLDPFDVPRRYTTAWRSPDEITEFNANDTRLNTFLAAYREHYHCDWSVARTLAVALQAILADECDAKDLRFALSDVAGMESIDPLTDLSAFVRGDSGTSQIEAACNRSPIDLYRAANLLGTMWEPFTGNPFVGEASYRSGEAMLNDHIVIVSASLPRAEAQRGDPQIPLVGTHLLAATVCSQFLESAHYRPDPFPTVPLVLDGVEDLAAGPGDLIREVVRHSRGTPLAPVLSGPPSTDLDDPLPLAISDYVDTEVVLAEVHPTGRSNRGGDRPAAESDRGSSIPKSLMSGSMDALERYFEAELSGVVAEGALCWLKTDTPGVLVGLDDLDAPTQPAIPSTAPPPERDPAAVGDVIRHSVETFGVETPWQ